ncbi:hypothetical protein EDD18DRAFT_1367591 [Armillaria luteobubalina]|uniref:Uncharacterized protein n=1 Tax=Armillaria luteobubalina TaxID=153913 RepID=A0AA39NSQ6_9AGAR|nr:hypothetical protein EDD18DRAFT_1371603 [Armillaria luteobubalina]KAK0474129.1 hypothetical protein EDD18DRAFT_1368073 [Armillaria luteobubalina]KAK0474650.1 hypothetical protein EDD18DRAFT_1367591 [Armillaria luteobubalina]
MASKNKKRSREQMLQAAARARVGRARNRASNTSSANSSTHVSRAPSPITITGSDSDDDIVILSQNPVASEIQPDVEIQNIDLVDSEDSNEQCNWNGETTHCVGYYADSDWEMIPDSGNDIAEESDEDIEELEGDELKASLESAVSAVEQLWLDINASMDAEMSTEAGGTDTTANLQDILMQHKSKAVWRAAESKRNLGYSGHSSRSQRRREKDSRDAEEERQRSAQRYASLVFCE